MFRNALAFAAVVGGLSLIALPAVGAPADCRLIRGAATPDTEDDVQVCRQDTSVHRATHPVGNLGEATGYPSWDTTKPTASFQTGAGGGALGSSVTDIVVGGDPHHGAHWEGTFVGPMDNLAISIYLIMPNGTEGVHGLTPLLKIDGVDIYGGGEMVKPAVSVVSDGLALAEFAFVDIYAAMAASGVDVSPDAEHDITVTMSPWYYGDDGAYVCDAAEVPSGIIFNVENVGIYTPVDVF